MVQTASEEPGRVSEYKSTGGSMRVAGMISGTSMDAIDVAICDFNPAAEGEPNTLEMTLLCFQELPMPTPLRQQLLAMLDRQIADLADLTELNVVLGGAFADALLTTLQEEGLRPEDVDLIGSHGQTIYYLNDDVHVRSTLQMGEPAVIAARTGVSVMADFRVADVAAGGLGAPLVSYFDALFFGGRGTARALQNIGGIGNVTFIPATRAVENAYAFDTGPGNVLIDYAARHFSQGTAQFDADGAMARRGRVDGELLEEVLSHPYFAEAPPKATGRELFGDSFAANLISRAADRGHSPEDTMATLTALTAESIARAYRRFGPAELNEVVLAGGGARNSVLVEQLRQRLPDLQIRLHDEFGVPAAAKEAVTFALLGYDGLHGRTTNIPRCTGAREAVTLGKLVPGRNYRALLSRIVTEMATEWQQPDTPSSTPDRLVRLKQ
jgi:anhydro-N-acetylmuramic acid kinase